jgi:hypothetical protein
MMTEKEVIARPFVVAPGPMIVTARPPLSSLLDRSLLSRPDSFDVISRLDRVIQSCGRTMTGQKPIPFYGRLIVSSFVPELYKRMRFPSDFLPGASACLIFDPFEFLHITGGSRHQPAPSPSHFFIQSFDGACVYRIAVKFWKIFSKRPL